MSNTRSKIKLIKGATTRPVKATVLEALEVVSSEGFEEIASDEGEDDGEDEE